MLFQTIQQQLLNTGFKIENYDFDRPWGGFFEI